MSIIRRIGATAAALVMAGGLTLVGGQTASADTWDGHRSMTATEVKENLALQEGAADVTCALMPAGWGTVCSIAGAASIRSELREAAARNCGLDYSWRATGSQMSYDKAEYQYTVNCSTSGGGM